MKKLVLVLLMMFSVSGTAADLEDPVPVAPGTPPAPDAAKEEADKPEQVKGEAGDTYNFYFQKGSGPGSVEQGAGEQRTKEPLEDNPQQKVEVADDPTFEGHLGLLVTPRSSGTGLALGGQFNATPKFGFQVHLISMETEDDDSSSSFSVRGSEDKKTEVSSLGGSVAGVFTPVTMNERNVPIRLSLLGGMMFFSSKRTTTTDTFSTRGSFESTHEERETKALAFGGISATARLKDNFGLVGYAKLTTDPDYSQIGLSAALLF